MGKSKKDVLKEKLALLKDEQRDFFWNKVFTKFKTVEDIPAKDLKNAIDLCQRTIDKNKVSKIKELLHIKGK